MAQPNQTTYPLSTGTDAPRTYEVVWSSTAWTGERDPGIAKLGHRKLTSGSNNQSINLLVNILENTLLISSFRD